MRFRYREYMGGPDPLAEPDPAPEKALAAARELLALVTSSPGHGAGAGGTPAPSGSPPSAGRGEISEEDAHELAALEKVLSRYVAGDRGALGEVDAVALGLLVDRLLGRGAGLLMARLDETDHHLSPRELRRLGEVALREVESARHGRGTREGAHGGGSARGDEHAGGSRPRRGGDDRHLDAIATVRAATLRRTRPRERDVVLRAEDVRVAETEPAEAASVSLLVDLSHSMVTRSLHEAATRTALALHTLVSTRRPEDRLHLVGFGERARELSPAELVSHDWRRVPGTNLHHALRLARTHMRRHGGLRPQVLVVTDGEPTAHLGEDGDTRFSWPPSPRTVELTTAELDAALRDGAEVTFFLLAEDPRLRGFQALLERRRGVRVLHAGSEELGPLVVDRYLRRPV